MENDNTQQDTQENFNDQSDDNQEKESGDEYVEEDSTENKKEDVEFVGGQDVQNFNWLRGQFSNLLHSFCTKYELNYDDVIAGKYKVTTDEGLLKRKLDSINDRLTGADYLPMLSMKDFRFHTKGKAPDLVSKKEEEKHWFANYILLNYGCNQQELINLQNSREGVKEGGMSIEDLDDPGEGREKVPQRGKEGGMSIEDLDDPREGREKVPQRGKEGSMSIEDLDDPGEGREKVPQRGKEGGMSIEDLDDPREGREKVPQRGKEGSMSIEDLDDPREGREKVPQRGKEGSMSIEGLDDLEKVSNGRNPVRPSIGNHPFKKKFKLYKKINLFEELSESEIFDKLKKCFFKPVIILDMLNIKDEFDPIAKSKSDQFYTALISSELFSEEANEYLREQWESLELIVGTFFEAKDIIEEMEEHNIAYTYEPDSDEKDET